MHRNGLNVLLMTAVLAVGSAGPGWAQAEPPKPAQIVVNDSGGDMQNADAQDLLSGVREALRHQGGGDEPGRSRQAARDGAERQRRVDGHRDRRRGRDPRRAVGPARAARPQGHRPARTSRSTCGTASTSSPRRSIRRSWAIAPTPIRRREAEDLGGFLGRGRSSPARARCRTARSTISNSRCWRTASPADKLYPIDRRSRVQEAGPDQEARHGVVDDRRAVGAAADRQGGRARHRLERPLLRPRSSRARPVAIEWNQGAIKESAFAIPKGAKDAYWGQKFLALAAEAKPQGEYADVIGYPGLNLEAIKFTDAKMAPFLPTHPDHLPKQFWTDLAWWNRQRRGGEGALGALDAQQLRRMVDTPAPVNGHAAGAGDLVLNGITRRFGSVVAVAGVDLAVRSGEMLTLLGPSGSGKTTLLKVIAGFELPDEGSVHARPGATSPMRRRRGATSAWCSRTTRCSRT